MTRIGLNKAIEEHLRRFVDHHILDLQFRLLKTPVSEELLESPLHPDVG